ncbi:MAG TPA: glycosyltransferase family 9 protein [Anaerolineales bacterium]
MHPSDVIPAWRPAGYSLDRNLKRVLVVRLDNIGDIVMLSPALRSLRNYLPESEITMLASPAGSQVAPLLPWVNDVIVWKAIWQEISANPTLNPERERSLVERLEAHDFEAVIIFTSFSQSPYPPAYACYLAGIPIRLGHSKEFGGGLLSHCPEPLPDAAHQVDRNLALLGEAGIPVGSADLELNIPPEFREKASQILETVGLGPDAPFVLLAPGASCSARRYDPGRFASVVRILATQTDLPQVIVGSPTEAGLLEPLTALAHQCGLGQVKSVVGLTSVPELAALIKRASLVIANNSASLHIADAFGRPMVILYSGTELESQWRPRHAPARLLRRYTPCSPCYAFECPYAMQCLDIPPEEVASTALELLANHLSASNQFVRGKEQLVVYGS